MISNSKIQERYLKLQVLICSLAASHMRTPNNMIKENSERDLRIYHGY